MTAPRGLPFLQRRVAEEAVRRGLVAAVVMEAAAREWASEEGPEGFPDHLVRRGLLTAERRKELEEAVAGEAEPAAAGEGAPGEDQVHAPSPLPFFSHDFAGDIGCCDFGGIESNAFILQLNFQLIGINRKNNGDVAVFTFAVFKCIETRFNERQTDVG